MAVAMPEVEFHRRCGSRVTLSNENRTATRSFAAQEFNYGLVLSKEPLLDNQLFEVKIDRKINSWSGSIEIGVTMCDPNTFELPSSATDLREGSWVMSGNSITKDGRSVVENYGTDLDKLTEEDCVGVMRSSRGELIFFVNGVSQGVAVTNIPERVHAVVDLYGKCAQVTITNGTIHASNRLMSCEVPEENVASALRHFYNNMNNLSACTTNSNSVTTNNNVVIPMNDKLKFHKNCGSLVKLSNNCRTAERRRPLDEFNNGVVTTHRPLRDDELFEIRIDRLVDKWSGSIEVGVTTHSPSTLEFPATMTNMRSGTTMMSGCGILTNGKGTRREYGEFNLDELAEGDRIAMMRKSNGNLHYFINGLDQGVASVTVPTPIWGVVDLYGMTVKVTIVDRDEREEQNLVTRRNMGIQEISHIGTLMDIPEEDSNDRLLFHPHCGSHASVINNGRTAHRPNATDDFNNAVVLTNRPLRPNELFEIHLDRMVTKWAGSIEIGVTTHSPTDLEYPSTMTNVRSGTWMMTGNGIMHNGTTVIDDYGQNLDRLKVSDRVGVMCKDNGTLHFFVNGVDQGPAAMNLPDKLYGVIDLYGQAAQATLTCYEPDCLTPDIAANYSDLRFHSLHGRNARVTNGGLTASRPHALGEFNDAIVITNRYLCDGEMFEVVIERMVDRWSGSIEAGVTAIRPEELDFPSTMTDIDHDTWMLSGSAIMKDGATVHNGYKCDLDTLAVGSRVGMMRHSDGTLHYYVNGDDQGVAFENVPPNIFAVVDLYGQCAQVSILPCSSRIENSIIAQQAMEGFPLTLPLTTDVTHRFSLCCGKNVMLKNNNTVAARIRNFNHGLVFSSAPLEPEETFEVRILEVASQWAGSLQIGLTTLAISDSYPSANLPSVISGITSDTWWITGSHVKRNGTNLKVNFCPNLDRLSVGDRVGVRRSIDGTMRVFLNGDELGIAASNLPKWIIAVVDLYGSACTVSASSVWRTQPSPALEIQRSQRASMDSLDGELAADAVEVEAEKLQVGKTQLQFHDNHGRNIQLSNGNLNARRTASYNQGIVVSVKPLPRSVLFQVRIEKLNMRWTSSLAIGVVAHAPDKMMHFPIASLNFKKGAWVISGDSVFHNGNKVRGRYGPNLDSLQSRHLVGLMVDDEGCLHLFVNGIDQGIAVKDIPARCYAFVDLYGQCEEVTIVSPDETLSSSLEIDYTSEKARLESDNNEKRASKSTREVSAIKNCEYQNACGRLKSILGLPEGYFSPDMNTCYCETCHKIRGDEPFCQKGEPPTIYSLPFGWCKFPLRLRARADNSTCAEKWHIAFHGTSMNALRQILDRGELLLPGELGLEHGYISKAKAKEEDSDGSQLLFSPTIRYAGLANFSPKHEFMDPKTRKHLQAYVAFQILVQPGSYKVGPPSAGVPRPADPHFAPEVMEWVTKERGATILTALLIKLDGLCV